MGSMQHEQALYESPNDFWTHAVHCASASGEGTPEKSQASQPIMFAMLALQTSCTLAHSPVTGSDPAPFEHVLQHIIRTDAPDGIIGKYLDSCVSQSSPLAAIDPTSSAQSPTSLPESIVIVRYTVVVVVVVVVPVLLRTGEKVKAIERER